MKRFHQSGTDFPFIPDHTKDITFLRVCTGERETLTGWRRSTTSTGSLVFWLRGDEYNIWNITTFAAHDIVIASSHPILRESTSARVHVEHERNSRRMKWERSRWWFNFAPFLFFVRRKRITMGKIKSSRGSDGISLILGYKRILLFAVATNIDRITVWR